MKYTYQLLIFLLLLAGGAQAQNNSAKLYGYSQAVVPGIAAKADQLEGGAVIEKPRTTNYTYSIYLTTPAKTRVYPIELWIKGEPYSARAEAVAQTPVIHTNRSAPGLPQKQQLVPKTTQKVTQLVPAPFIAEKSSARAEALAKDNELVLVYKQGGKTYFKTLKSLSRLTAEARQ